METRATSQWEYVLCAALGAAATGLGWVAFGLPNHPYQTLISLFCFIIIYREGWFAKPKGLLHGWLALTNVLSVAILVKLFIGSGIRRPFFWMQYPVMKSLPPPGGEKWYQVVPNWSVIWENSALATWELDLTAIQTFLLFATVVGGFFRFQPLASFTALLMILASLPAMAEFQWTYILPALLAATMSLYLQRQVKL